MTIEQARTNVFARVAHVTYKLDKAGRVVDRKRRKAVMILGVLDDGSALVRWLSHSKWESFKISVSCLLPY